MTIIWQVYQKSVVFRFLRLSQKLLEMFQYGHTLTKYDL